MQIAFKFDKATVLKIAEQAAILALSAAATYLLQVLSNQNFGEYMPVATALIAWATNVVNEWRKGVPAPVQ